jgi:electron transport complex protein RnfA
MFLKKFSPALYKALGIYLPLITTNCAVLGMATLVAEGNYTFLEMFVYSFSSAVGFLLVIYIFSTIREKLNRMEGVMKDIPIALITAGLMAMIFARFAGVI